MLPWAPYATRVSLSQSVKWGNKTALLWGCTGAETRLETGPGSARFQHHFTGSAAPRRRLRVRIALSSPRKHPRPAKSGPREQKSQACWEKPAVLAVAGHQSPAGASRGGSPAWLGQHVPACPGRAGGHGHARWQWAWQDIPEHIPPLWAWLSLPAEPQVNGRASVWGPAAPEPRGPVRGLPLLRVFSHLEAGKTPA